MKELIKINQDEKGISSVSARDLHRFLDSNERFSKWFDRMTGNDFEREVDYTPYQKVHPFNKQEMPEGVEFIRKRLIKLGVIIQSHELVTV